MSSPERAARLPRSDLARLIDHTALRPTTTTADIDALCSEAIRYGFWSVCVSPVHVRRAALTLRGSGSRVSAVVSFPHGTSTPEVKLAEARKAIEDGAQELDMVCNIGALKSGDDGAFSSEIGSLSELCRGRGVILKVILECCYLDEGEKVRGALLAERAGADFVKTSTGFGSGGATKEDVALLRKTVSAKVKVKAAGGIGTVEKALEMLNAGADRLGTSSGVKIMESFGGAG
jgi:deoxyribose-phosphate aldolase